MTAQQLQFLSDEEWIIACNLVAHRIMEIQDMQFSDISRIHKQINWDQAPSRRAKQIETVIKRIYKND